MTKDQKLLRDLSDKLQADERFLTHREIHQLCRLQQAEIERLQDRVKHYQDENMSLAYQLADSVSRETVIATEQERDEAREAACRIWDGGISSTEALDKWPWLEVSDE